MDNSTFYVVLKGADKGKVLIKDFIDKQTNVFHSIDGCKYFDDAVRLLTDDEVAKVTTEEKIF